MKHENLNGRVAVVTGGGGVLCGDFSKVLAKQGVKVAVLDLNEAAAQKVVDEITADGGTAIAVGCNVLDPESMQKAREVVNEKLGTCDILLNGAGGNNPKGTTTKETLEKITQVFARDMAQKENTCIVMISSMNAYRPLTKIPAYSAAKAAVSNFTQFMAVHFADVGIRVNAIAPGFFSTNQNKALLWNEDGTPTARTGKILAATPMKRFGEPNELDGTLLFLCDEDYSGFITGTTIPVDGGFNAYSGV